jgi:hypothetical protein
MVAILVLVTLLVEPIDRLHANQVYDADEIFFLSDRDLHGHGVGVEAFADTLHDAEEVRPDTIHLIDEGDAGHFVAVGLPPDGFRLGLHAAHGAEDGDRPVQHAHRTLHLNGEVHMSGCVDDVDAVVFPEAGGGGGGDGDAALLLLFHPVHRGGSFVNLADAVDSPCVVQDSLGRSRFARVDMRGDTDIACLF